MPGVTGRPECLGDIAHDSPETTTSYPIKIGGVAKNFDGTVVTTVAEDDRVEARMTPDGRQLIESGHPYFFHTFTTYTAAQTNASLVAAPGASLSLFITDISVNTEGNAAAGRMSILDGLTSTGEKIRFRLGTSEQAGRQMRQPIKLTANTALGVTTDVTTTSLAIAGYIAP